MVDVSVFWLLLESWIVMVKKTEEIELVSYLINNWRLLIVR